MNAGRISILAIAAVLSLAAAAQAGQHKGEGFEPLTRAVALERAAERFDRADADSDGTLAREEMREAAGRMRKGSRHGAERGEHRQDRAEAGQRHRRGHGPRAHRPGRGEGALFARIDADGDGMISAAEFAGARDAGRARQGGRDQRGE